MRPITYPPDIESQCRVSNFTIFKNVFSKTHVDDDAELAKSIGIGIGFLSCIGIGIGIVKTIFEVLVLVLVLLRGFPKYWYWYC